MPRERACVILVTAPGKRIARQLAHAALDQKLVACANLIPGIESHYWWEGKLARGKEVLILFKTTRSRRAALKKLIIARHPYDTPEFIELTIDSGSQKYLDWLSSAVSKG